LQGQPFVVLHAGPLQLCKLGFFGAMRFGKKLALQVMEDNSGAPYLSHKPMKEAINRTVRELRLYQARMQGWQEGGNAGGAAGGTAPASSEELAELEERIASFDRQLFALVDDDLARIHQHVRLGETSLQGLLAQQQRHLIDASLLVEESQMQRLEKILPQAVEDRASLCRQVVELRIQSDPVAVANDLQNLGAEYNALVDFAAQHSQYLEINVAGFRKLLKRHEKQIPHRFRSRPMPCLGFHRLVTHTSRNLLEMVRQMQALLVDARQRFHNAVAPDQAAQILRASGGQWVELQELRGLGPECEMVLNIQRQLKDPMNSHLVGDLGSDLGGPSPGFLYPKPGGPMRIGGQQQQQQQQQNHQQPQHQQHNRALMAPQGDRPSAAQNHHHQMHQQQLQMQQDMMWGGYPSGHGGAVAQV